jgi:ABC-2 type transport system ATP-binding protein
VLLRIRQVTKVYRRGVRANDDVTLDVDAGEVVGLFGHNGAGKTTLLHQVIGLVRPTSGTVHIAETDAVADPAAARRLCSLQPQSQAPIDGVTPRQAIEVMARIRGASRRRARERAAELLAGLDLEQWADTVGEKLSGGVRRLTAFCMAAAEPGRVVMLDEPTNDVDPVRRRLLWGQIRALADSGCAVLLVTHNVVEAERGVQRLAVLHQGRVVAEGTPAQLRGRYGDRLRLELVATDEATASRLTDELADGALPIAGGDGAQPARTGRRVVVGIEADTATDALGWAQRERERGRLDEFAVTPVSLEDVYIGLVASTEEVGHAARAA